MPFRPRYRVLPAAPELPYARPGLDDGLPLSRALRLGSTMGLFATPFAVTVILAAWATGAGALNYLLALSVLAAVVGFPATIYGAFRRRSRGWWLHALVGLVFNGIVLAVVGGILYIIFVIGVPA